VSRQDGRVRVTASRLIAACVGLLLLVGAGYAGSRLRTPGMVTRTVVSSPGRVTASVVYRRLVADTALAGRVARGSPTPVYAGPVEVPDGSAIVTRSGPPRGSIVQDGSQIAEVGGEPVFLLQGSVPMYRTLSVGMRGTDVKQLQADLASLGFYAGAISGEYDAQTAASVARWFASRGYDPPLVAGSRQHGGHSRSAQTAILPEGEVAFKPNLPATVLADREVVGRPLPAVPLTIAAGPVDVQAVVTAAQAAAIARGDRAQARIAGRWLPGRVAGVSGGRATIVLDRPIAGAAVGRRAAVRVIFQETARRVLAVPAVAIQTAGDGSDYVVAVRGARLDRVRVDPGASVGGEVAIRAIGGGLRPGDRVVVGA